MISGVVNTAEPWESCTRVTLAQPHIATISPDRTPARVRVRLLRREPVPRVGQAVSLRAVLMPPTPPALPGAYDFARQAYLHGIGGVGYAVGHVRPEGTEATAPGTPTSSHLWTDGLRTKMQNPTISP